MAEFWQLYQAHHEALRSILFLFGFLLACVGMYLGFRRLAATEKQANTAERNLFNDWLGRGVELLSDAKMTMRSAGVRVLENLAEGIDADSDEHRLVFNILLDFVRDRAASPINHEGKQEFFNKWPAPQPRQERLDIELAIRALGNIALDGWRDNGELNLSRLDLRRLDLSFTKLERANFDSCSLQSTDCTGSNFPHAGFWNVNLQNANLSGVELENAHFQGANLEGVVLAGAKLVNAFLPEVNLQGANLGGANLQRAKLRGANLQSAILLAADFENAHLKYANLQGVVLKGAKFDKAQLNGADISGARRDGWEEEILNVIIYEQENPPKNMAASEQSGWGLPPENLPVRRAYEWREVNGRKERFFVESDQRVNEWIYKQAWEEHNQRTAN